MVSHAKGAIAVVALATALVWPMVHAQIKPQLPNRKKSTSAKEAKSVELKTTLATRGALLFSDDFTEASFKKNWRKGAGIWEIKNDAIRISDKPGEGHHPYAGHRIKLTDAIIQFKFRFEKGGTIFVGLDKKGAHVARVVIDPRSFRIQRTVGIGPTTKSTVVDRVYHNFIPGRWYTLLWEIRGNEMTAQIDNRCLALGKIDGIDDEKLQIQLMSNKGTVWYDELRIWKAEENPKWLKVRNKLAARKRSPCK